MRKGRGLPRPFLDDPFGKAETRKGARPEPRPYIRFRSKRAGPAVAAGLRDAAASPAAVASAGGNDQEGLVVASLAGPIRFSALPADSRCTEGRTQLHRTLPLSMIDSEDSRAAVIGSP